MTSKVSELEAEIERIGLDKQAAEEITETLRSSVDARQRIIGLSTLVSGSNR